MLIGYARVSTREQVESLAAQRETLTAAGCQKVYEDQASGVKAARPGLEAALEFMREDDVLVVTRLDRLGRSALDTMKTLSALDERGVRMKALDFDLDTATPSGRLVMGIFIHLAQWERELLIQRTHEGLAHARAQGRMGGRHPKLDSTQQQAIRAALDAGMKVSEVATLHGVSVRTIYRVRSGSY